MKKVQKWTIETDGTLIHTGFNYPIVKEQLLEKDWIIHLMKKSWVDLNEFMPKYFEALKRMGVDEITMKTNYHD